VGVHGIGACPVDPFVDVLVRQPAGLGEVADTPGTSSASAAIPGLRRRIISCSGPRVVRPTGVEQSRERLASP
jgi:hypothetical protein